jgi:hypothetical protein
MSTCFLTISILFIFFGASLGRNGNSIKNDESMYSCSRNLNINYYVSKNNKNSSCEEVQYRGVPRIIQLTQKHPHCDHESNSEGKTKLFILSFLYLQNSRDLILQI